MTTLRSLLPFKTFIPFHTLQSRYNFPSSELTNYLQIKNFYTEHYSLNIQSQTTLFEHICLNSPRDKGLISIIYRHLNDTILPEKSGPMLQWEADLDISIPLKSWNVMIENLRKCNIAASFRESPMKLFSRLYLTPSKIHSFYPSASPNCFRGCNIPGTYLHIFWDCVYLEPIWNAAANKIESITKKKINLSPQLCILYATIPDIPISCIRLTHSLISSIQWMIALNWKSQNLPWTQVLSRMDMLNLSERIYHTLHDSMHSFDEKWSLWSRD